MNKHNFPADIKKYSFQMKDFLGVDFTTHESEVNDKRSPDALNLISGLQGSVDKRFGTEILKKFEGKIWAVHNIKTAIYTTNIMPDGLKERIEVNITVVHEGTHLWAYNPYLDVWMEADVWDGVNPMYKPVLQERQTNFIEYSNQNYYTLIHNNWITNKDDLMVLYCFGRTETGYEGQIFFMVILNDSYTMNLYYPTTSIARSPDGKTSTKYEQPNALVNVRINKFLSNSTDKTFVLDFDGNTYSFGDLGGFVSQMLANGTFGTPHDASGNPITWTYDNANHSITFSAVPHATYKTGVDNIEVRFLTTYSTKKTTNKMNEYTSFVNYGFNGLNDLIFFCNSTESRFRSKEIWISIEQQNEGETKTRLYFDPNNTANLGSNRKIGYSKIGEYLVSHGIREGNSPVAYLKRASLDENGEMFINSVPTTSQVGALSPKGFANLRDDPLWISEAGVSSVIIDNITNVQSIQDRGFYINQKLLKEPNLDKALSFVFDNKYFVCVNGNVYIADSRRKSMENKSYSESFQYEWYYWEGLDVQSFIVVDGELLFGTTDGRLMKYKNAESDRPYTDEIMKEPSEWALSVSYSKGDFVSDFAESNTETTYTIVNDCDNGNFTDAYTNLSLLNGTDVSMSYGFGYLEVSYSDPMNPYMELLKTYPSARQMKDRVYYVRLKHEGYVSGGQLKFAIGYSIHEDAVEWSEALIGDVYNDYSALIKCTNSISLTTFGYRVYVTDLHFRWDDVNFIDLTEIFGAGNEPTKAYMDTIMALYDNYISSVLYTTNKIKQYFICIRDHVSGSMRTTSEEKFWNNVEKGTDRYYVPVLAYWSTPIINMGDTTMRKTLKNLWVRLGKYTHMRVKVYYSTKGVESEKLDKYDGLFDFSNLDFNQLTFSTDTDPSVMVTNRQERKFMSIQFRVESRDSNPFSLLEIVGKYTFNNQFKG